jgi:L-lactate dehydrogenase
MRIRAGNYPDLADADVIVICAGANQKPGETRLDLLTKNAGVFRQIVPRVLEVNHTGIIVIATNPVDILTQISADIVGLTSGRVIGSGTILDTARFRTLLGAHYGLDPRSVHAYIVGEHGDTAVPLWSSADIGGVPLAKFTGPNGRGFDQTALDAIFEQTRTAAYQIIQRKQATYYAIGLGLLTVIEAILRDQHTVLTVSSPLNGQVGVSGMSISLPTVVGRRGVMQVLELPMSDAERAAFQRSASVLQERYAQLE